MAGSSTTISRRSPVRLGAAAAVCAALLVLALQALAIERASIHWDEFATLHLADLTHTTGTLHAGGRPGLAVALLVPFVADCVDEIRVVHGARLLWFAITLLFLAGLWTWLSELGAAGEPGAAHERHWDATFGVALLVLTPAFLDSSLQVRTDHIALAGGAWGGALLLRSRGRVWLSLLSGVCFGIGLLGSQKVLYVAALAGVLTLGQHVLLHSFQLRREALRGAGLACGAAFSVLAFRLWVDASFDVPAASQANKPLGAAFVASGFSLFEFYRSTIGWREYRSLLPELAPHIALAIGLALATFAAVRRRSAETRRLLLAWAVLALGTGVLLFHAAAFRYFWLTLGLFPAAAFAIARRPLLEATPQRLRGVAVGTLLAALALPALLHALGQLRDPQAIQRDSLAFVHRNFTPETHGFHPESGLVCQAGAQPLRTWFSQHIHQTFESPKRDHNVDLLIDSFRSHEVAFLVQSFRLNQFPVEVRRFWDENYQPYRGSIFVAGRRLSGNRGDVLDFDLLVPGAYRWLPLDGPQPLGVDRRLVPPGGIVELAAGPQRAEFVEDVPRGMLLLALDEAPGEAPLAFYGTP